MKSSLLLGSIVGCMALVGVTTVGVTYLLLHPARPAPQPVAMAAPKPSGAPSATQAAPLPSTVRPQALQPPAMRPRRIRLHTHRHMCPVPAVYRPHRSRRARVLNTALAPPLYTPAYPPPPAPVGWYRRPRWREPGWRYPPRWAYGPGPGYGPGWRDW